MQTQANRSFLYPIVLLFCLLTYPAYGDPLAQTPIVITEINYNSSDNFNPDDWIELYNRSNKTVDLSRWLFKDIDEASHAFIFPEGTWLEPDHYLIICRHLAQFKQIYPQAKPVIGEFGFGLSGGGEALLLFDNQNALIDSLFYDDKSPWPSSANGKGATLQLIHPDHDNADVENWKDSDETGGSPGQPNNPRRGHLVINEFMAHNTRTIAGPRGEFCDWIELYNLSGMSLNLKGLYLTDDLAQPQKWELPDTTLVPSGYLIIWTQSDTQNTALLQTNFRLAREGEQIGLFDRKSWQNTPLDTLSFGPQRTDFSTGRIPDGSGVFRPLDHPTPDKSNTPSDFDSSGTVDFVDFLLFASHFGTRQNQTQYENKYDLNLNGLVDFADFLSFVQSFGR